MLAVVSVSRRVGAQRGTDLAFLDCDPLEDIATLTKPDAIAMVVTNGRVVAGQALDSGALRRSG